MVIIGAGLAGCLAGLMIPNSTIIEPGPNKITHQALLRFRTPNIGNAVGIQFEKVKVYKGIWHNDESVPLTPRAIALYSRKVSDTISYRSITNLDTAERYIAPANFHNMLKDQLNGRIKYDVDINMEDQFACISTLPIFINAKALGVDVKSETTHTSIFVNKFIVPDCNVHMTYYFTDPTTSVYRASLSGSQLII